MTFLRSLFFLLLIPLFLSSDPFYWGYINEIGSDQDSYFGRLYNLSPCMEGGGGIHCVTEIGRGYAAPYPTDLKLARIIMVGIANRFLQAINSHQKLKPHLKEYPFPIESLKITLSFPENPKSVQKKQISYVLLIKGKIFYEYHTHTDMGYETFHEETFTEANAIVAAEKEAQPLAK